MVLTLLQGEQHLLVQLVPKRWIPFHTFELEIVCGETPILTDYGFARLEISKLQIDFGSTTYGRSGSIERFLSKKVSEAVQEFLEPHQFALSVSDKSEHSVWFTLCAVGSPIRELTFSDHFETSRLSLSRAMPASAPAEAEQSQEDEPKVA